MLAKFYAIENKILDWSQNTFLVTDFLDRQTRYLSIFSYNKGLQLGQWLFQAIFCAVFEPLAAQPAALSNLINRKLSGPLQPVCIPPSLQGQSSEF